MRYLPVGKKAKQKAFEEVFGFPPPDSRTSLDAIKEAQRAVDNTLKEIAIVFAHADTAERKAATALAEAKNPDTSQLVRERLKTLRDACHDILQKAKYAFWHAHGLAAWAGLFVWPIYRSYLPTADFIQEMEKVVADSRARKRL